MSDEKILDISWQTIFKLSLVVVIFYLVYSVRDLLASFIFALVISVLLDPIVDFLQKIKIPRFLGVFLVYFFVLSLFGLLIYLISPLLVNEINQFIHFFPEYFSKISPPLRGLGFQAFENINSFVKSIDAILVKMSSNIFEALFTVFGGVASFLFIISVAFFISSEEKAIEKTLSLLFTGKYESYALSLWRKSERKIAGWFGARILACLFVGVASYITFLIFGIEYPVILALFAGVFNFIPYIGPIITGLLFFVLIFPTDPVKSFLVIIAFIIIQQIENNIISPVLIKKVINVPSAIILISLVIGGKLWGILGSLLAIPLFGILFDFTKEFLQKRKEEERVKISQQERGIEI